MRLTLLAAIAALLLLSGCASREELVAKSAAVPAGLDLSGEWQLSATSRGTVRRIRDAEHASAGGAEGFQIAQRPLQRAGRRSSDVTLVQMFLVTGESLKVSQTEFGLFISFDRAIVEEYRFGEKRLINVGEIQADRVSGWQDNAYIIETLDMDGGKLIETYRLDDDGQTLIRSIVVINNLERQIDVRQSFDRR